MAAVLLVAGCGGGEAPAEKPAPKPKAAASASEFADRFERLTGMPLRTGDDTFGTRLDEPDEDHLGYRISGFSYVWTRDDGSRDVLLRGSPGPGDTRWDKLGDGWSVAKAYGPRLVVSWVGADSRAVSPEWERIDRLTHAAYTGDDSVLAAEERPCPRLPLSGDGGPCSVNGIPVVAVDGRDELVTGTVEASVTGLSTSRKIGVDGTAAPPKEASGTWVVVAYRLRNAGTRPIQYLRTALRIGDETFDEDAGAAAYLPRTGTMPLAPGAESERQVAFDVPASVAARARREGALVLPAERDELGDPNIEFAQGWVRLATVPDSLPDLAPPVPEQPPPPTGPPAIAVERGDGPAIGGSARRLYTANSFFPVPPTFVGGGVPAGTRAGACLVPRVGGPARARLLDTVRRDTPPGKGRVTGLPDRMILLADCGRAGRWAMVAWVGRRGGERGPVIFVDEFQWRGGAWHGSPKGRWPGCGIPEDAAAAWQIDISHCAERPEAPGERS
jgi:hypothetical protein